MTVFWLYTGLRFVLNRMRRSIMGVATPLTFMMPTIHSFVSGTLVMVSNVKYLANTPHLMPKSCLSNLKVIMFFALKRLSCSLCELYYTQHVKYKPYGAVSSNRGSANAFFTALKFLSIELYNYLYLDSLLSKQSNLAKSILSER